MDLSATIRPAAPGAPLVCAFHGQWEDEQAWPRRLGDKGRALAWVFPRGPYEAEVERGGRTLRGNSWYTYTGEAEAFAASLRETGAWVLALLDHALRETKAARDAVHLLGFSQGGYLAGSMALLWPERFAGAAILGARFKTELLAGDFRRVRGLRLFAGHGRYDRSVRPEPALRCAQELLDHGVDVKHRAYACGHRVLPEMIDDALAHLLGGGDAPPGPRR